MTTSYLSNPQDNSNIENFINAQQKKCVNNNIVFNLSDSERVAINDIECNGFFYPPSTSYQGNFSVAIQKPFDEWFSTFIHESSHIDQFVEKSSYWVSDVESYSLDQWLNGVDYDIDYIKKIVHRTILLEADCELRSVEKIKQFNLPINIEDYSRKANSYILFYHSMLENRQWYNKAPYEINEIVRIMNPSIMKHLPFYLNEPNKNIMKAMALCFT